MFKMLKKFKIFILTFFLFSFFIFLPKQTYAATISPIGTLKTGQEKFVTVSDLIPNGQYYWREAKLSFGGSITKYHDCSTADVSGEILDKKIGPIYDPGDYILTLTLLPDGTGCIAVLPDATDPRQEFTVIAAPPTSSPFNPNLKCSDQGITNPDSPIYFPTGNYILNFKITNNTTLNFLKDKSVRLHANPLREGLNIYTDPVLVTDDSFPLAITNDRMKSAGLNPHTATLEFQDPATGNFTQICSDVKYEIIPPPRPVDPYACAIDLSNVSNGTASPNSILNFQFSGGANTVYKLKISNSSFTKSTTTNSQSRGIFLDIPLNGRHGDTLTLYVTRDPQKPPSCSAQIKLDVNASHPGPLPTGPPPTPTPRGTPAPSQKPIVPAVAGGKPCGSNTDPAIATAIGCIHTSPIGFTQDILKFAVAISGGIAFLMMLMGAFQMLTSAGNPETLKGGQDRLTSAIVGLLIVILAVILLRFIGVDILGILKN